MKGRALRRALATKDAIRVNAPVALIQDTTELVTPASARELLDKNTNNRPINWRKVEEYAAIMKRGEWKLHAQGIVLDTDGNLLTGQKRLWAVIYSGASVYMRISRGNPKEAARLLDRGTPQSARDLAARTTGRKHSPIEAAIARACCALAGNLRPSTDALAQMLEGHAETVRVVLEETAGTKKTRALLMILAVVCTLRKNNLLVSTNSADTQAALLEAALLPHTPEECWGKGLAFGMAMDLARRIVTEGT